MRGRIVAHPKCFSFGIHIDWKNKYMAFHLYNRYFQWGDNTRSYLPLDISLKLKEMNARHIKEENDLLKEVDLNPLQI